MSDEKLRDVGSITIEELEEHRKSKGVKVFDFEGPNPAIPNIQSMGFDLGSLVSDKGLLITPQEANERGMHCPLQTSAGEDISIQEYYTVNNSDAQSTFRTSASVTGTSQLATLGIGGMDSTKGSLAGNVAFATTVTITGAAGFQRSTSNFKINMSTGGFGASAEQEPSSMYKEKMYANIMTTEATADAKAIDSAIANKAEPSSIEQLIINFQNKYGAGYVSRVYVGTVAKADLKITTTDIGGGAAMSMSYSNTDEGTTFAAAAKACAGFDTFKGHMSASAVAVPSNCPGFTEMKSICGQMTTTLSSYLNQAQTSAKSLYDATNAAQPAMPPPATVKEGVDEFGVPYKNDYTTWIDNAGIIVNADVTYWSELFSWPKHLPQPVQGNLWKLNDATAFLLSAFSSLNYTLSHCQDTIGDSGYDIFNGDPQLVRECKENLNDYFQKQITTITGDNLTNQSGYYLNKTKTQDEIDNLATSVFNEVASCKFMPEEAITWANMMTCIHGGGYAMFLANDGPDYLGNYDPAQKDGEYIFLSADHNSDNSDHPHLKIWKSPSSDTKLAPARVFLLPWGKSKSLTGTMPLKIYGINNENVAKSNKIREFYFSKPESTVTEFGCDHYDDFCHKGIFDPSNAFNHACSLEYGMSMPSQSNWGIDYPPFAIEDFYVYIHDDEYVEFISLDKADDHKGNCYKIIFRPIPFDKSSGGLNCIYPTYSSMGDLLSTLKKPGDSTSPSIIKDIEDGVEDIGKDVIKGVVDVSTDVEEKI